MIKEIKLPEIAANVTTAVVLEILVSVGDKVNKDDSLAEMESDKATFDLPSEDAGVVKEIKVKEGDEVKVGQVMFTIDTEAGAKEEGDKPEKDKSEEKEGKEKEKAGKEKSGKEDKKETDEPEEEDRQEEDSGEEAAEKKGKAGEKDMKEQESKEPEEEKEEKEEKELSGEKEDPGKPAAEVPAPPSVRRLAREIGVDVRNVRGSGPESRITMDDVKAFAKKQLEKRPSTVVADDYELPDFSKWGNVRREKMATIRKITGKSHDGVMANHSSCIPV
jgi:pyruvate dehydrogenase E2 component (dihydrolipoamide acetyltransferase)